MPAAVPRKLLRDNARCQKCLCPLYGRVMEGGDKVAACGSAKAPVPESASLRFIFFSKNPAAARFLITSQGSQGGNSLSVIPVEISPFFSPRHSPSPRSRGEASDYTVRRHLFLAGHCGNWRLEGNTEGDPTKGILWMTAFATPPARTIYARAKQDSAPKPRPCNNPYFQGL
jgi:hypothetical protein